MVTPDTLAGRCPSCESPVEGAGRFCVRCGAALPPVAVPAAKIPDLLQSSAASQIGANTALGPPQSVAANAAAGQLPGDVLAVAGLAVACGVLLAWPNGRALWTSLRYLAQAHYGVAGERLSELSGFMTALIPVAAAAGLVACGLGLLKRIRAARGLGIVLAIAIAFSEVLVSHRTGWETVTLVGGLALAVALAAFPGVRTRVGSQEGSSGSAVASVVISFIAWAYLALGAGLLAVAAANSSDKAVGQYRGFGVAEILLALVVLALTAPVRRGELGPSRVATVLLAALAVSLATGQRWASPFHLNLLPLGYVLTMAISLGAAVAAWPRSASAAPSAVPMDNAAAPQRARLSGVAKTGLIGGALVLLLASVLSVSPNHSASSADFTAASPSAASDNPQESPAMTAPPVPSGAMTHEWNFTMTRAGGYVVNGVVSLGDPGHYQAGLTNGEDTAGSACTIDPQADAVIPLAIRLTNATSGFSTDVAVTVGLDAQSDGGGLPLMAEIHYTDGSQCFGQSSGSAQVELQSSQPLVPGGSTVGSGFLVIPGYYTPNYPTGDSTALADTDLAIAPTQDWTATDGGGESTQFTVSGVDGPGVSNVDFGAWTFNVAGEGAVSSAPASSAAASPLASVAASPAVRSAAPVVIDNSDLTNSWSFTEVFSDGGQGQVTLSTGGPLPFQAGVTNGGDVLGACGGNSGADAVVPFELTLASMSGQGEPVGVSFAGLGSQSIPGIDGPILLAESDTSAGGQAGTTCDDDGNVSTFGVLPQTSVAPGAPLVVHGFFRITNYYGGSTSGPTILDDTILTLPSPEALTLPGAQTAGPTVTLTDATGPGVGKDSAGGWTFDLAGAPAVPAG